MEEWQLYDLLTKKADGTTWIFGGYQDQSVNVYNGMLTRHSRNIIVVPYVAGLDVEKTYNDGNGEGATSDEFDRLTDQDTNNPDQAN